MAKDAATAETQRKLKADEWHTKHKNKPDEDIVGGNSAAKEEGHYVFSASDGKLNTLLVMIEN